jgi:hypothetical protein
VCHRWKVALIELLFSNYLHLLRSELYQSTTAIARMPRNSNPIIDPPFPLTAPLLPEGLDFVVAAAVVSGMLVEVGPILVTPAPELAIVVVAAAVVGSAVDAVPAAVGTNKAHGDLTPASPPRLEE